MDNYAVYVNDAVKSYGSRKVLDKFCMRVPKGCIYGLLGASGCGKTTLLSCVVGRKHLDEGDVWVLGGKPGKEGSGVPGPNVGYMPQDIALVAEFTVRDAVFYFGRILNMEDELIEERFTKLKDLLDLPDENRLLKNCSGGQQRRVSFAAAMVHKPQLLILDEPTVGLDPVLRDSIWNYLVEIAEKEQTAVIITTHYIEEARQAHKIGLMREGKLLAEESPERLLQLFNTDTLEEVFLVLSRQQEEGRLSTALEAIADDQNNSVVTVQRASSDMSMTTLGHGSTDVLTPPMDSPSTPKKKKKLKSANSALSLNKNRVKSLLAKNVKQFLRNYGGLSFTFMFPILEMCAFLLAVGGDPKNIPLGVVNDERMQERCANYTKNGTAEPYFFTNCNFTDLGCRFLNEVVDPMYYYVYFDDLDEAIMQIKHGKIIGVMHVAGNFSDSFTSVLNEGRKISNETLENSQIKIWLDMSNRQIGASVKFRLLKRYQDFQVSVFKDCNLLEKFGRIPLRFKFEYGVEDESYTNFMVPGVLLTVIFFLGTTLTSTIIVTERREGVWDRSIVAGVSSLEIVLTHFIIQFFIVFLQAVEVIVITFAIFGIEFVGKLYVIFIFVLLQGLVGMILGFWISVVSDNHTAANIVSTGIFYPMIVLCGLVWPLEAQPLILRIVSQCLPFTIPIISLRQVIKKGHDIIDMDVLPGIGITLAWIFLLTLTSIFAIKAKR